MDACLPVCRDLKRFLHISSLAAAGPSLDGTPLREDAPSHPVSHYGRSKMMSEQEVLRAAEVIPTTILRPPIVYGPAEKDLFDYFRMVKSGVFPMIGTGCQLLNMIYADDLVDAILQAAACRRTEGGTYFVGSERQYSSVELAESIGRAVGREPVRIYFPGRVVIALDAIAGTFGRLTRRRVFFNLQKAKEATQSAWICSIEKAQRDFGFRQKISLDDGMRKTYEWYRSAGWIN